MTTPLIGAVAFAAMQGRVPECAMVAEDRSRPGLNGHEKIQIGTRGEPGQLTTTLDVATAAAAKSHIQACQALQGGDLVTVTYADGQTTTNVFIERCVPASVLVAPISIGGSGSNSVIVKMHWSVHQATPT